ncbi:hypothetical protein [Rathayibacter sp. VKM Ac-2760]|uniref:hypothetical protein n=1 Tax=Rathayibacter sp. VKM Ac-2760 TaxID=2609253 RepID=UPI001317D142|nr:hypothetical protein [Rathayibacter sp. VKM Ac-2760]QHC58166.1 hypothetical protein GSU72_06055 [Rathayibacter sp. VKM Ac-2760]
MHADPARPPKDAQPERSATAEHELRASDSLFVRLNQQAALLAAAEVLAGAADAAVRRWSRLLHDYALTSDRVVSVHGDAEAATLGWLKPRGVVALLVVEECEDDQVVEHLAAALGAMNAVSLTVDRERAERLAPLTSVLGRLLPGAFVELAVDAHAHYPEGATAAVLTPGHLYRAWTPPEPLPEAESGTERDDDERLALLTLYGRVRQLDVRPE